MPDTGLHTTDPAYVGELDMPTTNSKPAILRPDVVARVRVRQHLPTPKTEDTPTLTIVASAPDPSSTHIGATHTRARSGDYDVGHSKPPVHTRFKKGQSGNPKGRPKGAKSLKTLLREVLLEKVQVRTANGRKNMSRGKAMLLKYNEAAFAGSPRAIEWFLRQHMEILRDEADSRDGKNKSGSDVAAPPVDMDAHDKAILDALRANLLAQRSDDEEPES